MVKRGFKFSPSSYWYGNCGDYRCHSNKLGTLVLEMDFSYGCLQGPQEACGTPATVCSFEITFVSGMKLRTAFHLILKGSHHSKKLRNLWGPSERLEMMLPTAGSILFSFYPIWGKWRW
jgi:hypothetical protein